MCPIIADPETLEDILSKARAGDRIELAPGIYSPTAVTRVNGTRTRPIHIIGRLDAIFDSGQSYKDFQYIANSIAKKAQLEGRYPGIYLAVKRAFIRLENCSNIVFEGISFNRCWPTAICIEDSDGIAIRGCTFREGSFAIYAEGNKTEKSWSNTVPGYRILLRNVISGILSAGNLSMEQTLRARLVKATRALTTAISFVLCRSRAMLPFDTI
jgi:hypothetical protein